MASMGSWACVPLRGPGPTALPPSLRGFQLLGAHRQGNTRGEVPLRGFLLKERQPGRVGLSDVQSSFPGGQSGLSENDDHSLLLPWAVGASVVRWYFNNAQLSGPVVAWPGLLQAQETQP